MNIKKTLLVAIILVIFVFSLSIVNAGLFDGFFGGDDSGKNITLIKESIDITRNIHSDGKIATQYWVKGVFKDLPNDVKGYNLKILAYGENGNLIKENEGFSMQTIAESSKNSEPSTLGYVLTSEYEERNANYLELTIIDKNGQIVFDKNITVNIDTMNIHYETKTSSSSSSDSSDSSKNSKNSFYMNDGNPSAEELKRNGW